MCIDGTDIALLLFKLERLSRAPALRISVLSIGLICLFHLESSAQLITVNNDLVFGAVFPGIPKTISKYTAGAAAEFHVSGTIGKEVSIDFTLPTKIVSAAGIQYQMIFSQTSAATDSRNNPDQSNPLKDNQNPWHTILDILGPNGLTIWLGGQVVPKLNQSPGSYTAIITLTVAYTGN